MSSIVTSTMESAFISPTPGGVPVAIISPGFNVIVCETYDIISCGENIESAAEKSGFNDPKYFSRVVKKHFKCTPRELKLYGR